MNPFQGIETGHESRASLLKSQKTFLRQLLVRRLLRTIWIIVIGKQSIIHGSVDNAILWRRKIMSLGFMGATVYCLKSEFGLRFRLLKIICLFPRSRR